MSNMCAVLRVRVLYIYGVTHDWIHSTRLLCTVHADRAVLYRRYKVSRSAFHSATRATRRHPRASSAPATGAPLLQSRGRRFGVQ